MDVTSIGSSTCDCCASTSYEAKPLVPVDDHAIEPQPTYFTFKGYLSDEEAASFFDWDHDAQVAKVAEYLDFVGRQPAAAQFTSSKRASISWAEKVSSLSQDGNGVTCGVEPAMLDKLVGGRTKSGFGASGTDDGFLPQRQLSLAVARSVKQIGHEYIVERTKKGEIRPPVLNSRSFFFNWCHAEKQKLMDIRLKLDRLIGISPSIRRGCWEQIVVVVDREMCPDCVQYATRLAVYEEARVSVKDPRVLRVFPPSDSPVDESPATVM